LILILILGFKLILQKLCIIYTGIIKTAFCANCWYNVICKIKPASIMSSYSILQYIYWVHVHVYDCVFLFVCIVLIKQWCIYWVLFICTVKNHRLQYLWNFNIKIYMDHKYFILLKNLNVQKHQASYIYMIAWIMYLLYIVFGGNKYYQ